MIRIQFDGRPEVLVLPEPGTIAFVEDSFSDAPSEPHAVLVDSISLNKIVGRESIDTAVDVFVCWDPGDATTEPSIFAPHEISATPEECLQRIQEGGRDHPRPAEAP